MGQIRKNHSAGFKAQLTLATTQQFIKDIFSGKQAICETNHLTDIKDLNAKIGQLTMERDFLKNYSRRLGLLGGKK